MYKYETIELGAYRGDDYYLTGFVEPEPYNQDAYDPDDDAEEYGVALAQAASGLADDTEEIVVMDTCHMGPHLDKRYLPDSADEKSKVELGDEWNYTRMKTFLTAKWRQFVDCHHYYTE